jgi:Tfp pilus assembly protein PilF
MNLEWYGMILKPQLLVASMESTIVRQSRLHLQRGCIQQRCGELASALLSFEHVCRIMPNNFVGHFNRALMLLNLRQPEAALDAAKKAASLKVHCHLLKTDCTRKQPAIVIAVMRLRI